MHMTLPCFAQLLGGALSLCSVTGGCSLASLSHWGDAPSLRSVAGGMLPHFAQLLGGCSLASLSRWGMLPRFAHSLGRRSLASLSHWGMLPCFAQSLGRCSLASLSRWEMLPCFAQSLGDTPSLRSVTFHSMVPSNCSKICILEGQ